MTPLVWHQAGHLACKKLGVGLLVAMIWLALCMSYSSSCHQPLPSSLAPIKKGKPRFIWKMAVKTETENQFNGLSAPVFDAASWVTGIASSKRKLHIVSPQVFLTQYWGSCWPNPSRCCKIGWSNKIQEVREINRFNALPQTYIHIRRQIDQHISMANKG